MYLFTFCINVKVFTVTFNIMLNKIIKLYIYIYKKNIKKIYIQYIYIYIYYILIVNDFSLLLISDAPK